MPPTELDVPLVPSAEQIRRRMFASVRRGFDPDQVRDYLEQIADQVERLERELKEARLATEAAQAKAAAQPAGATRADEPAAAKGDPYQDLGQRVADVIRSADEQARKSIGDARMEAQRLLDEARGEADRVRTDAQAKAERARSEGAETLRRAREEADRALGGLASRRESLLGQLREMQGRLVGVATELENAVRKTDATEGLFTSGGTATPHPSTQASAAGSATPAAPPPPPAPLDPKYEDLWASGETVDLTDIPSLDIDLEGEPAAGEEQET